MVRRACRDGARTLCVTGTKGKSTTTALLAHLLRAGGHRTALAGNIGLPLLELLDAEPQRRVLGDRTVQLPDRRCRRQRRAAGSRGRAERVSRNTSTGTAREARYVADKLRLLTEAQPRIAVLNAADPTLAALHAAATARCAGSVATTAGTCAATRCIAATRA